MGNTPQPACGYRSQKRRQGGQWRGLPMFLLLRLECSGFFAHFYRKFVKMVKLKQNPWWNWKLVKYGEIKSNQLVRPACSQVASAAWPKVKQTVENICEPREICVVMLHEAIIATTVRHGQITKLFFGQLMWYLRIPSTASRMDHMQAKALNIFQESNTTVSHLLP